MIRILNKYRFSFMLYGSFLITGVILTLSIPKTQLHLLMNSYHTEFLDSFIRMLTFLGDGWIAVIATLFFILFRFRYALMAASSGIVSGLLAQSLKRFCFRGMDRPAAFLDLMPGLQLVEDVQLHHHFSFPSGHTTTAFAILILAGFISGRRQVTFSLMILAWLVGYSRIYISQHFLPDVLAGSFIGLLSALFFYWYFQRMNIPWLDKSIIRFR